MRLGFNRLKDGSDGVQTAFAAERSARNRATRRAREVDSHAKAAASRQRRRGAQEDREVARAANRKVRVQVPEADRPGGRQRTPRKLFYRLAAQAFGTTSMTTARGPDGRHSVHFAFVARGFASTKGRRWRDGEGERAVLYIVREDGLERGEFGWFSNIGVDRNELTAFCRTSEALERHDRSNANVYCSEVISLPAELSARQRRRLAKRLCKRFVRRGLPFVAAIHVPDPNGDQRNYHLHVIYSLRPCERIAPYDWSFGVGKVADINTPEGIRVRRVEVVSIINTGLAAAHIDKRYTHLSNKARGMEAAQPKKGQNATWVLRRLGAAERSAAALRTLDDIVTTIRSGVEQARVGMAAVKNTLFYRLLDRSQETFEVVERLRVEAPALEAAVATAHAREADRADKRTQLHALLATIARHNIAPLDPVQTAVTAALSGAAALVDDRQAGLATAISNARGDLIERLAAALPSLDVAREHELTLAGARAEKRNAVERAAATLNSASKGDPDFAAFAKVVRSRVNSHLTHIDIALARNGETLQTAALAYDKLVDAYVAMRAKQGSRERTIEPLIPDPTREDAAAEPAAVIALTPPVPVPATAAVAPLRKRKRAASEELRELLESRKPERDMQSSAAPGAPTPTQDEQARAAARRSLVSEAAVARMPEAITAMRAQAWARLGQVGAIVTLQRDGSYDIDDASLLDDERRTLRDPAQAHATQQRLELIHAEQRAATQSIGQQVAAPNDAVPADEWTLVQQADAARKARGHQK